MDRTETIPYRGPKTKCAYCQREFHDGEWIVLSRAQDVFCFSTSCAPLYAQKTGIVHLERGIRIFVKGGDLK